MKDRGEKRISGSWHTNSGSENYLGSCEVLEGLDHLPKNLQQDEP